MCRPISAKRSTTSSTSTRLLSRASRHLRPASRAGTRPWVRSLLLGPGSCTTRGARRLQQIAQTGPRPTRTLIRGCLAFPRAPQMLLQLGVAPRLRPPPCRAADDLIKPGYRPVLGGGEQDKLAALGLQQSQIVARSWGANWGANDGRHQAALGDVEPLSMQLDATSGDVRRRLATPGKCLLSSRSQVRILLGAQVRGLSWPSEGSWGNPPSQTFRLLSIGSCPWPPRFSSAT